MRKIKNNQDGMVAIIVTVFFIIVLSLIVLAFSQSSRREQRQSLDQQLSSQAFYAAESGVNDTLNYIKSRVTTATPPPLEKVNCATPVSDFPGFPAGNIGDEGNASYSCILYDRAPRTIQIDNVDTENASFKSLDTDSPLQSVTFSWKQTQGSASDFSGCVDQASDNLDNFPTQANYTKCDAGMLRVSLFPVKPTGVDRDALSQAAFTVFLRPTSSSTIGTVGYSERGSGAAGGTQGQIIPAGCQGDRCQATINGLGAALTTGSSLYVQIRSIYKDNSVTISGTNNTGSEARFTRAQLMVDATGKANDVLRRIQVRVPLFNEYQLPGGFVVDSKTGVCKRIEVFPGSASAPTECGGSAYFN